MKKKVAIFANGWGGQFLQEAGGGIRRCALEKNVDLFSFVDYCAHGGSYEENMAELNIFRLPDFSDFDGVIFATNSFNIDEERNLLLEELSKTNIPAVSLEYDLPQMPSVGTDNYKGMNDLVMHLLSVHKIRNFLFVSGIRSHMESEVRLKAIRDAIAVYGIELPEENVLYADWSANTAVRQVKGWMENHDFLPEAIICANDIMALGIDAWLKDQGYAIPGDIIVTGYDCLYAGQINTPALTSVSHSWDEMGYQAMKTLWQRMEGLEYEQKIVIPTAFVCGESCGCKKTAREIHPQKVITWSDVDTHFRHMYKTLRKVSTAEGLNRNLSEFIMQEGSMEGENFMLCLHPNFFDYNDEVEPVFHSEGYYEPMDAVCAMHKGAVRKRLKMSIKRSMFQDAESSKQPVNNIFVPVRSDSNVYGYAMLSMEFDIVQDNLLYIWTRHMNQYMEQVGNNVKLASLTKRLQEMSITDGLTGVYNRSGSQQIIEPALMQLQKEGKQGVFLLVDIDRMKTINDSYGHVSGDIALRAVSTAMQAALPANYMVSRFGGDEFIAAGEHQEGVTIEALIDSIAGSLHKQISEQKIPFHLSVSVGGVLLLPEDDFKMENCIHIADESMYQMKKRHHEEIDAAMKDKDKK